MQQAGLLSHSQPPQLDVESNSRYSEAVTYLAGETHGQAVLNL